MPERYSITIACGNMTVEGIEAGIETAIWKPSLALSKVVLLAGRLAWKQVSTWELSDGPKALVGALIQSTLFAALSQNVCPLELALSTREA